MIVIVIVIAEQPSRATTRDLRTFHRLLSRGQMPNLEWPLLDREQQLSLHRGGDDVEVVATTLGNDRPSQRVILPIGVAA